MDLVEALSLPPSPARVLRENSSVPKAGEPGSYEWDGNDGTINTQPTTENITTWDEYIKDSGLDPIEVEVVEPVQIRGWDSTKREWNPDINDFESSVVRMHYYRLTVRRKRDALDIQELLDLIAKSPESESKPFIASGSTFVVALADIQTGKLENGKLGVQRVTTCLEQAAEQLKFLSQFTTFENVHIAWLGDNVEGFVSQGGDSAWRTPYSLTEQVRILRKLMLFAIELFYPLAPRLSVVSIPGNHDQAVRFGKGGVTKYNDSFDVEALLAVQMACDLSGRFDNVSFYVPEDDEMTVTLETSNTIITHAHGHKFRGGKAFDWWKGQAFGEYQPGQADILLSGHVHHLQMEQSGKKTSVRVPALEEASNWYRHQSGEAPNPGLVTLIVNNGDMLNMSVHHGSVE